MLRRDFEPGGMVEYLVKDLQIALDESKQMGISMPGTALAHQFLNQLMIQGGPKIGMHGLLTTLEKMNNTEIKKYDI